MTKEELLCAQYLLGIAQGRSCHRIGTLPDPTAPYGSLGSIALQVRNLRTAASRAFLELTGKLPNEVSLVQLSTRNPADWTKHKA